LYSSRYIILYHGVYYKAWPIDLTILFVLAGLLGVFISVPSAHDVGVPKSARYR
jgi:hypothetical protein